MAGSRLHREIGNRVNSFMRIIEDYGIELLALEAHIKCERLDKSSPRKSWSGTRGRAWYLRPEGVKIELTGIDLDKVALDYRKYEQKDLDKAIVGDLRTVALPPEIFDVVYCSFVLEHIEGAERALDNMVRALKPKGLLIIRIPDLGGVQTYLSRRLPRWVAIAYYRYAWKIKKAGQPAFAPYPTSYDEAISTAGFHDYCRRNHLEIVEEYGVGSYTKRGTGLLSKMVPIVARLVSLATLGRVHDRYVDLTFVVRKTGTPGEECAHDFSQGWKAELHIPMGIEGIGHGT